MAAVGGSSWGGSIFGNDGKFGSSGSSGYYDLEEGLGGGAPVGSYGDPSLRWGFIRKVYGILSSQVLLTFIVASLVSYNSHVRAFALSSPGFIIFMAVLPLITLCALSAYHQHHPYNLILLGIFTASMSVTLGLSTAFAPPDIVFQALLLTTVVVISLTIFTFWAASQGVDFSFLGPLLFVSLVLLIFGSFIQIFFPFGHFGRFFLAGLGVLIFSAYIIYDTQNLIQRFSYDEYIWASVALYLDIVNLFINILNLLQSQRE